MTEKEKKQIMEAVEFINDVKSWFSFILFVFVVLMLVSRFQ